MLVWVIFHKKFTKCPLPIPLRLSLGLHVRFPLDADPREGRAGSKKDVENVGVLVWVDVGAVRLGGCHNVNARIVV